MACRGLCRGLRSNGCAFKTGVPGFASPRRTFTSSNVHRKHGAVPNFTEVSTPELQDLLTTLRENVFLPAHLSKPLRNLIFKTKNRKTIEDDPVTIEVAGEDFQLKHIDRTKDQPGTVEALLKAISFMEDKKDWNNVPILLEGLKTSGRKVKQQYLEKLVRKAGQAGRQSVIIECARRVSRTGFMLKDLNLVRQVMWWIQHKPLSTQWNADSTRKALYRAEQVAFLMEEEEHIGGGLRGTADPRARPEVVGVLLQLAAAHAKLSTGKDEDGKVQLYAKRLLGTLERNVDLQQGLPEGKDLWVSNVLLCYISPILYGIREAAEILGSESETVTALKKHEVNLKGVAASERKLLGDESSEGSVRLGVWCYDNLVGPEGV